MMGLNERSLKYFVFDSGWDNIQIPNYPFFIFNTCSENCGLRLGNCGAFSSVFFFADLTSGCDQSESICNFWPQ